MKTGDVINNPVTGQRLHLIKSPADTQGAYLTVEHITPPHSGRDLLRPHIHSRYRERFEILAGRAAYELNGRELTAGAGDVIEAPPKTVHVHPWNVGDEELRVRQTTTAVEPDLKGLNDTLIAAETLFGLAHEGKVNARGEPGLLQLAVLLNPVIAHSYFAGIPRAAQRAVFGLLAALGLALGYRRTYPAHAGLPRPAAEVAAQ